MERLFFLYTGCQVPFSMKAQMIATAETPVTVTALEGLLSCVLARMSGEFVTSGKLPGAAFPLANVGLLSRVCASVCLQVR